MKKENNNYNHQEELEKDMKDNTKKDNYDYDAKIRDNLNKEEGSNLNVGDPYFEIFQESQIENNEHDNNSSDSTVKNIKSGENFINMKTNTLNSVSSSSIKNQTKKNNKISNQRMETSKTEINIKPNDDSSDNQKNNMIEYLEDNLDKKDNSKSIYEEKLKDLEERVEEYNQKYQKLEEKIEEYEKKSLELVKKRKKYEDSIKEYEEKKYFLEERNEEISDQMNKLKEAREKIIELTNQIEEKKIDLEQRDENLKKSEKNLEKIRFELEKNKLEFEKNKLEYEIGESTMQSNKEILDTHSGIKEDSDLKEISDQVKEKKSGKAELLHNMMIKLSQKGNFNSCFLIDGKGMLVSEYSNTHLDSIAVGAMFSLICTAILRTVETLKLHGLEYFKIASINGEFILKNINIMHYERNFILLAYYNESNLKFANPEQIINKKTIRRILKSAKKEFYELEIGNKTFSIFDNLTNKINFLKKRYAIPQEDLELTRINLLNETSVEIKNLFETL